MATGCSSSGEYDYEDFPEWQACIDKYIEDMAGYYKNNNDLFDDAIERCKQLTPKKK
jgi:hypothetical protein